MNIIRKIKLWYRQYRKEKLKFTFHIALFFQNEKMYDFTKEISKITKRKNPFTKTVTYTFYTSRPGLLIRKTLNGLKNFLEQNLHENGQPLELST